MAAAPTSSAAARRPHALLVPFPCSGHINPTLHLARLLHSAGFVVTFVSTEHNHALMRARARGGGDGFRYEAIPDGLSPSERRAHDYGFGVLRAVRAHWPGHLRELIARLNSVADDSSSSSSSPPPPVTCVVASELMSFALDVAASLGVAAYVLWGTSACGLSCGLAVRELRRRAYVPLKVLANR
ncbi:linamarin synthase 2-like [Oryza brachyantha]|uniref:linamarin synthase 2-like n=1 Tax=Oryza brachyantha TaxID=4533 RepID=UPI001ADCC56F|nr:linamarin synthase 2-like [Oryza brachyantha]